MDDEAWNRELVLRARYRESLESRARERPESSSYNISDEAALDEGLNVCNRSGWSIWECIRLRLGLIEQPGPQEAKREPAHHAQLPDTLQ